jgi:hypothetical protein
MEKGGTPMITFDKEKFKNLVLYVCSKCEPKELGSTKLNKVLWYSDMFSYLYHEEPVTGETYVKRQFGPVSKHVLPIINELEQEGKLVTREDDYFGYGKKEYIALKKPNLDLFTGPEISLVDDLIEFICKEHTAKAISAASHDRIWELAEIGEEIPYHAFLASKLGEIDEEDIEWAMKSAGLEKAA